MTAGDFNSASRRIDPDLRRWLARERDIPEDDIFTVFISLDMVLDPGTDEYFPTLMIFGIVGSTHVSYHFDDHDPMTKSVTEVLAEIFRPKRWWQFR